MNAMMIDASAPPAMQPEPISTPGLLSPSGVLIHQRTRPQKNMGVLDYLVFVRIALLV